LGRRGPPREEHGRYPDSRSDELVGRSFNQMCQPAVSLSETRHASRNDGYRNTGEYAHVDPQISMHYSCTVRAVSLRVPSGECAILRAACNSAHVDAARPIAEPRKSKGAGSMAWPKVAAFFARINDEGEQIWGTSSSCPSVYRHKQHRPGDVPARGTERANSIAR
jgi:hypothetical protein